MDLHCARLKIPLQLPEVCSSTNISSHRLRALSAIYSGNNASSRSPGPWIARSPSRRTQMKRMAPGACAAIIPYGIEQFCDSGLDMTRQGKGGLSTCGPGPICQASVQRYSKLNRRRRCFRRAALAEDRVDTGTKQAAKKKIAKGNDAVIERLRATVVEPVNALEPMMQGLSLEQLRCKTEEFKLRLAQGASLDDILSEAFAVVREASSRLLGMRHFDVQLIGGAVLHEGCLAEMYTGEGKTLMASLPAYLNALSGKGVCVCTANDFLAQRDCEQMGQIYSALGLTTGLVTEASNDVMSEERKAAYRADITYCSGQELAFDYLRDNTADHPSTVVQRPTLAYAIVDEADSLLIDEARNPMLLSTSGGDAAKAEEAKFRLGAKAARALEKTKHYTTNEYEKNVQLTDEGMTAAERVLGVHDLWDQDEPLANYVILGLTAKEFFRVDHEYMVKDGKVVIVDESTGRMANNRRWGKGVHQAVEAKEGLDIEPENRLKARTTYQNFFELFDKLAGMTGTAKTEAEELWNNYHLNVVTVPPNRPNIRKDYDTELYFTAREKWDAVLAEVYHCYQEYRPVLVGTTSVEDSELVSRMLTRQGIPHSLLNARPKYAAVEAQVIAQAGRARAVTISTSMAGRGTDIILGGSPGPLAYDLLERTLLPVLCAGAVPPRDQMGQPMELVDLHQSTQAALEHAVLVAQETAGGLSREQADEALRNMMFVAEAQARGKQEEDVVPYMLRDFALTYRMGCAAAAALLGDCTRACKLEAEFVRSRHGLHVLGCGVHTSRRIDNQLRGRAGRQGDPGSTVFFVSMQDKIVTDYTSFDEQLLNAIRPLAGDQPFVCGPMVDSIVEKMQKHHENINAVSRQMTQDYDSVLEVHRHHVYALRRAVLYASPEETEKYIRKCVRLVVDDALEQNVLHRNLRDWDIEKLIYDLRLLCVNVKTALVDLSKRDASAFKQTVSFDMKDLVAMSPALGGVDAATLRTCIAQRVPFPEQQLPPDWPVNHADNAIRASELLAEATVDDDSVFMSRVCSSPGRSDMQMAYALRTFLVTCMLDLLDGLTSKMLQDLDAGDGRSFTKQQLTIARKTQILQKVSEEWESHLQTMETLRETCSIRAFGLIDPLEEYGITGAQAFQMFGRSVRQSVVASVFQYYTAGANDEGVIEELQLGHSSQDSMPADLNRMEVLDSDFEQNANGESFRQSFSNELYDANSDNHNISLLDADHDEISPIEAVYSQRKPLTSSKGLRKGLNYGPEPPPILKQPPSQHLVEIDGLSVSEENQANANSTGPLWG